MRYKDQQKYLEVLKRYERKLDRTELEDYKMLLKRHKDDEDLDKLSFERLQNLYEKYHLNREKKNFDHLFKTPDNPDSNS